VEVVVWSMTDDTVPQNNTFAFIPAADSELQQVTLFTVISNFVNFIIAKT